MSARIDKLIGLATLQGLPITGYRRFGVPPGGAFDQESLTLANALLGNPADALAIEISNGAIELEIAIQTRIAIVGAGEFNKAFDVGVGERVSLPAPRSGLRTYLAVCAGWLPEGVTSPLARAGMHLKAGDTLTCGHGQAGREIRLAAAPESLKKRAFRVLSGPQPIVPLPGLRLIVSNQSDRVGIRLDGRDPFAVPELPSEPACVGVIQVTPSGQLVVIGPDGPTIGGYPKIGVVCSADLDALAHLRPGDEAVFEEISLEEAHALAADRSRRLEATRREVGLASHFWP